MFICDNCANDSKPGQPQIRVVTEWRVLPNGTDINGRPKVRREIAVEKVACSKECAEALKGEER